MTAVPDWLRLQKVIFQRFVSQKLKDVEGLKKITDLIEDMKDGNLLVCLLETLSGHVFNGGKALKPTKMRIQMIDNVSKALDFAKKDCGIKTTVSAENVVDGEQLLMLGLVFAIIIKYTKLDEEDQESGDIKEALLLWLKNRVKGYENAPVENMGKSLHNGMVFNALIHRLRPRIVPYSTLSPEDAVGNCKRALETARDYLGIEEYLQPSDIPKLDELGMLVFVLDWYAGIGLLQKQDIAARRIGRLADMTKLHDEMRANYIARATLLSTWVDAQIEELSVRIIDNSMAGVRKRLETLHTYKSGVKSEKIVEALDQRALFDDLSLRLRNNQRPPFNPPEGLSPDSIDERFNILGNHEAEYSVFYHAELQRQVKLDKLGKRFRKEHEQLTGWTADKTLYAHTTESLNTVDECEFQLDMFAANLQEDSNMRGTRVMALGALLDDLKSENYEYVGALNKLDTALRGTLQALEYAMQAKKENLDASLAKQLAINDNLCREFADAVKAFQATLREQQDKLNSSDSDNLENQLALVEAAIEELPARDADIVDIGEKDAKVIARSIVVNPYTTCSLADATCQLHQTRLLMKKKADLLRNEIENAKRSGLSDDQMLEISNNFEFFDTDKTGFLNKRELKGCCVALGEEMTADDLTKTFTKYAGPDGKISREEFIEFMKERLGDSNTLEEILTAFGLLSYGEEFVTVHYLTSVVNDLTFKQRHVDYLEESMAPLGSGLDYKKWTEEAFAR